MLRTASPFLLFFCSCHPSQQDLRGEIEVQRASAIAVNPAGDLWLASRDGRVHVSRDRSQSWSEVQTPARKAKSRLEDRLEHIGFFDLEHAIISGYIGGEDKNEILRTEDGGKTWSFTTLPRELWVYDMQVMAGGHAWLVGSNGELLTSDDYGATWRVAGAPFDAVRRSNSVWFASPVVGVVGALINAIKLTADGGRTWRSMTTPLDALFPSEEKSESGGLVFVPDAGDEGDEGGPSGLRPLPPGHQDPVERVWILGETLLALQRNRLFQHPLGQDGAWSPVEFEGRPIVRAEAVAGGLIAVTEDRRVVQISEALQQTLLAPEALEEVPVAMARDARGCALLMRGGRVCLVEERRVRCSNLYSEGVDRNWPISSFDRIADGALFGVSSTALYRSVDSGESWERLIEKKGLKSVAAFEDGTGVVLTTAGGLETWTEERGLAAALVCGANEQRLSIEARKNRMWIATSFETGGGARAERMLRTSDTVLVGPDFTALVYASVDDGRSWKKVDRCAGSIVHALWLGNDDVVSMCMSNHSIRSAKLDGMTGAPESPGFRSLPSAGDGLGGQWASWIAFPLADEGWVGGRRYFGDPVLHRTQDRARTWQAREPAENLVTRAYRLGSGACVRVVGFWREGSRIEIWREGAFQEVRRFAAGIHDAYVDTTGCLLVRLENAEVWELSRDEEWARIGLIHLPPD